jgi:sugar phosphate isomerase/epimerase
MRFGYATVALPTLTPAQAVGVLADLGYEGIEWKVGDPAHAVDSDARRFLEGNLCTLELSEKAGELAGELASAGGLQVIGLNPYVSHDDPAGLRVALRMATRAGAPQIRLQAPRLGPGRVDHGRLFGEFLSFVASGVEEAREHNIRLVIELHHRTLLPSVGLAKPLLSHFDPSQVGVIYDVGNLVYEGYEDYRLGLAVLGPYLHHVHLKNARAVRRDPGGWGYEWAPLNDGLVDLEGFFAALAEASYDGWVSIEDLCGDRDSIAAAEFNAQVLGATTGTGWGARKTAPRI